MEKITLASASCYNQLYYFNPEFEELPKSIQDEIKYICVPLAEKLHCIMTMGFYTDGSVFIEATAQESDFLFDEIGSKLEIRKIEREQNELLESLQLWYAVYKTPEGEKIKQELLSKNKF